jgi:hypothetical protein
MSFRQLLFSLFHGGDQREKSENPRNLPKSPLPVAKMIWSFNPPLTSQFQDQRFEMVIVMPGMYKGLMFFADSAKTGLDNPLAENIFRKALDALEPERTVSKEYTINMPTFTVDSNIDVNKYLRAVRNQSKGSFNKYVDMLLSLFDHKPTSTLIFLL